MLPRKKKYLNEFYIKVGDKLELSDNQKLEEFNVIWNLAIDTNLNVSDVIDGYIEKNIKLNNKTDDVLAPVLKEENILEEVKLEKLDLDEKEEVVIKKPAGRPKK